MQHIQYQIVRYPFEYPFGIAKGTKTHQDALSIQITYQGFRGYGETTSIHYYQADVHQFAALLNTHQSQIEQLNWSHPTEFHAAISEILPQQYFLISALDIAIWDIYAQMQGKPLFELFNFQWHEHIPPTDYTLGVGELDLIAHKIQKHPFPIYKIKLDGKQDAAILNEVRKHTSATIRIDANEGWNLDQALSLLPLLQEMPIDCIEQPFQRSEIHALQVFKKLSGIPIIADEAFTTMQTLDPCLHFYDGINIKLSKCGGITPALQIIEKANLKGAKIMLGSMSDGIIGSSALSHLAPKAHYLDIDGPFLFNDEHANGIQFTADRHIRKPQQSGIGAHWLPEN